MASVLPDRPSQVERKSQAKVCVRKTHTQRQRENERLCVCACVCMEGQVVVSLVSNAIYVCAFQTSSSDCGQEKTRKRGKKRSRVMDSPPSQEVDDINKKLIILPQATSEGLARAIHCSLPLLLLLIHLTLYIPRRPRVG